MINEFFDGMDLREEQFLVVSYVKLLSTSGNPYATITLQDSTGTIEAKKWIIDEDDSYIFTPGHIVSLNGEVLCYKGNMQIKISSARDILPENVDLSRFLIQSNFSEKVLRERFNNILKEITDEELLKVVKEIYTKYDKDLFTFPAAKRNHHNYLRGLITHTLSVAEICSFMCEKYKNLNKSLLLAGALLHDVGKIIELSGPLITKYTTEGGLIGHISIGHFMVKETCLKFNVNKEKSMLLEHLILSHHGKLEYGSPVLPCTKEAILLAMIDDIDAKMELSDNVLNNVESGDFSTRIMAMDDRLLYKPKK